MEEDETADESTTTENTQDPQDSQDQESLLSDDQTGHSSEEEEEEVSDSINEFTSPEADPTPHQRKRAAVKVSSVHKKSRTDENPLNFCL